MIHKLHVYTGNGKGKTTAAMGLALRAAGHGYRVMIAQFMKDGMSGELAAFGYLPKVRIVPVSPMKGFTFQMTKEQLAATCREQTEEAERLTGLLGVEKPDVVILDELAVALAEGIVMDSAARTLINTALLHAETIVTGRKAPEWLTQKADYVTEMKEIRHPWQTEQLNAREGVEW